MVDTQSQTALFTSDTPAYGIQNEHLSKNTPNKSSTSVLNTCHSRTNTATRQGKCAIIYEAKRSWSSEGSTRMVRVSQHTDSQLLNLWPCLLGPDFGSQGIQRRIPYLGCLEGMRGFRINYHHLHEVTTSSTRWRAPIPFLRKPFTDSPILFAQTRLLDNPIVQEDERTEPISMWETNEERFHSDKNDTCRDACRQSPLWIVD